MQARTTAVYDPESGRTADAEALQARIRTTASCTKCEPIDGHPGRLVLDSAGSGEIKRRRFKCNQCKATLSVSQYLAVYSGHADLLGDTASEASRRTNLSGAPPVSSENTPSGASGHLAASQLTHASRRNMPAPIAASTQQARIASTAGTQPAHSHAGITATQQQGQMYRTDPLPTYFGQPNAGACGAIAADGFFSSDERKAYIEQTLDRLGLVGTGRKRRRLAMEVLLPVGRPTKTCLTRVAIPCGNVNAIAAKEAIRAFKVDPRLIHHVIKTDVGIELIVMSNDAVTIEVKATQQGLLLGEPKARRPPTRKECDALLKALTPAANSAQHEATRDYIRDWIDEIKANLPAHIRAARPHMGAQAGEARGARASGPSAGHNANASQPEADPLDAMDLGCFDQDIPNHEEPGRYGSLGRHG